LQKKIAMKTYILLLSTLVASGIFSQHEHFNCGSHHKEAELRILQPEIEAAYRDMRNLVHSGLKSEDGTIIIPIVFHIIHLYGPENISDQQVYRQVEILNQDFQKLNADKANVVPFFRDRVGNANIRFELARFDPFGECSNGINRYFNFETLVGDDFSKLSPWPRTRYLNVWVVRSMANGVAGYAYYPSSVEGAGFWRDGIVLRHNYIGDSGTSNPINSRALTHEVGHWLGLAHTWGSTNNPGLLNNCLFDDGIEDTPNTIGWTSCKLNGTTCDNVLDNIQNFMEYTFCSNMFTQGQCDFMRTLLHTDLAGRNALWNENNLNLSLGDLNVPVVCNPIADFNSTTQLVCMNTPVQFTNFSWRISGNAQYLWEFPESNTPTSTAVNPIVTWSTPGWKSAKLTVNDENGTNTRFEHQYIFVSPSYQDYNGPTTLNFDNELAVQYIVFNPENNEAQWKVENNVGIGGSRAMFLRNVSPHTDVIPFTAEFFYQNRLGGKIDEFVTPSFNLSNTSNVNISFRYAAATKAISVNDMTERLRVFVSTNCGQTWNLRQTLTGMSLINNGSGHLNFEPNQNTIWGESTFFLTGNQTTGNVRLKFEYTASDFSNNIAIDNIIVSGVLSIENFDNALADIVVFPNPVVPNQPIMINIPEYLNNVNLRILNNIGQEIMYLDEQQLNNQNEIQLDQYHQFSQGVYHLTFSDRTRSRTVKLVVL
jgi:PKD repeat protein